MRFVIERSDGGASIGEARDAEHMEEMVLAWISHWPNGYVSHREVEESAIPADRTFRNALKPDLTHDMPKSREIHCNRLRDLRQPLFAENDIAIRDAQIDGDN